MIDTTTETLLTFTQAANELPRRRRGRKVHTSTLHRWASAGSRGIVLETILTPGGRLTSREALQRFFEALTRVRGAGSPVGGGPTPTPAVRSPSRRRRDSERAGRELESMGA